MLPKSREEEADDAGENPGAEGSPVPQEGAADEAAVPNRKAVKKIAGRAQTKERLNKAKGLGLVQQDLSLSTEPASGSHDARSGAGVQEGASGGR